MAVERVSNLLRENELAAYLGLSVGVFRRWRYKLQAAGLPQPLVSLGPADQGRPLWSLRAVDRWLDQGLETPGAAALALRDAATDMLLHAKAGLCTTADELAARAQTLFEDDGPSAA